MNESSSLWRNALITLTVVALITVGLGIIIYVGLARERILPTPTPRLVSVVTPTALSVSTPPPATAPAQTTVVGTVREYTPGALIILLTPLEGTAEQVIIPENTSVQWADNRLASPSDIAPGQTLYAEGTLDALGRLIAGKLMIVRAAAPPTATLAPSPQATATLAPSPTPTEGWKGEYFSNETLSGAPVLVRHDATLDFKWQLAAPAAEVPADRFSVRWRSRWTFDEGGYRFYTFSEDGMRLWVDGVLMIDQWQKRPAAMLSEETYLPAGAHDIQVEYFHTEGEAQARVWWEHLGLYPDWKAEYYDNVNLTGSPVLVRNDGAIDWTWGDAAPAPGVPADRFSVRWTQSVGFDEGPYRFDAVVQGGVRVWVDGPLLIDAWHDGERATYSGYLWLDRGPHNVRVEFYDEQGQAEAHVQWSRVTDFGGWKGEYYANADLAGRPAFVRDDQTLAFSWQDGSAAPNLPNDGFSVRWTRTLSFEGRRYRFEVEADGGVRLFVDGRLALDRWEGVDGQPQAVDVDMSAGAHTVVVEYADRGGNAALRLGWEEVRAPDPPATRARPKH